jgi:preprotein translocase subunit SecE
MASSLTSSSGQSSPLIARAMTFWAGLKTEFKKIIWPSPMQIVGQTIVVVIVVTLMTLLLWGLDTFWRFGIGLITPHRLMGG